MFGQSIFFSYICNMEKIGDNIEIDPKYEKD